MAILLALSVVLAFSCSNPLQIAQKSKSGTLSAAAAAEARATSSSSVDFREESIYFLLPARFIDGDPSNNVPTQWCSYGGDSTAITDPNDVTWRGDFKGLIETGLDYIHDLGFTAVWLTPVVQNRSPLDYHGYHAWDFNKVDPRLESEGYDYQAFIDKAHSLGMKVIQDVVWNHSGRYGIKDVAELKYNTDPTKSWYAPDNPDWEYDGITPNPYDGKIWSRANLAKMPAPYNANLALYNWPSTESFVYTSDENWFHHVGNGYAQGWDDTENLYYKALADDCPDLNTESTYVRNYLVDAYKKYIDMGVDAFRVDTVKHMERSTVQYFVDQFKAYDPDLFIFGEVAQKRHELHSVEEINPHWYTWTGAVGSSSNSGLAVLDFFAEATFHNIFEEDQSLSGITAAARYDSLYSDPSTNVMWLDNHDFGPNNDWNQRYSGDAEGMATYVNFTWTWRGIPTLYYGSEIQFMKGAKTDITTTTQSLETTGRAYYGDEIASAPSNKLYQHIKKMNAIRKAIPALQKGSWAWAGTASSGDGISFTRTYNGTVVAVGLAKNSTVTFNFTGLTAGTYRDAVTGNSVTSNGSLSFSVDGGSAGIYVLNGPGIIGGNGVGFFQSGSGGGGSTYSISGTVTNNGSALSGVTVTAGSVSATTGSAGTYTLSGLSAGTYTVKAALSGYTFSPASTSVTIGSSNVTGINFSSGYSANYSAMYLRGSMNTWGATAMSLSANNTWKTTVSLTAGTAYTYKYEIGGSTSWSTNWGLASSSTASTASGTASASGYNICFTPTASGTYTFTFNDSTLAYAVSGGTPTCATPTFSVTSGSAVVSGSTVTISSGTSGSTVYYTTDGTTPTTSSSSGTAGAASASVTVSAACTVKAISALTGYTTSAAASASYTILSIPSAPTNLTAGTITNTTIPLTWTASTGAATYNVFYTTDASGTYSLAGSATSGSYTLAGLTKGTTYYIKVCAVNAAGTSVFSNVLCKTTTSGMASNQSAMYLRGSMNSWGASAMTLTADYTWTVSQTLTAGTTYTYKYEIGGGSSWSTNWGFSSSSTASSVSGTAKASGYNMYFTPTSSGTYVFSFNDSTLAYSVTGGTPTCDAPTFSVTSGSTIATSASVTLATATSGATIYYTTDGSTPTTSSSSGTAGAATATVALSGTAGSTVTVKAIAVLSGYATSSTASASYTYASSTVNAGRLNIVFVNNASAQSVTFPGDFNSWSLTSNKLTAAAGSTNTIVIDGAITATTLARGDSTSALELQLCNQSSGWSGAWSFSSWTKGSGLTVANSKQITIPCTAANEVTLTINVATTTLSVSVK